MFERNKTYALANNAGPSAFSLDIAKGNYDGPLMLEAWISNFGSSNVHIIDGRFTLPQCQDLLESGLSDLLLTVTGSGPSRVGFPDATDIITVFFEAENTSGQFQAVTVRVFDRFTGVVPVPRS